MALKVLCPLILGVSLATPASSQQYFYKKLDSITGEINKIQYSTSGMNLVTIQEDKKIFATNEPFRVYSYNGKGSFSYYQINNQTNKEELVVIEEIDFASLTNAVPIGSEKGELATVIATFDHKPVEKRISDGRVASENRIDEVRFYYTQSQPQSQSERQNLQFLLGTLALNFRDSLINTPENYYTMGILHVLTNNFTRSNWWNDKAMAGGHKMAFFTDGVHYLRGTRGRRKDPVKAYEKYHKGAELGSIPCMMEIARMYGNGTGFPVDRAIMSKWHKIAAKNGDPGAMSLVAKEYETGDGVNIDLKEAIYWYEKAMAKGDIRIKRAKIVELEARMKRMDVSFAKLVAFGERYKFRTGLSLSKFIEYNPPVDKITNASNMATRENGHSYSRKITAFGKLYKEGPLSLETTAGYVTQYTLVAKGGKKISEELMNTYVGLKREAVESFGEDMMKVEQTQYRDLKIAKENFSVKIPGAPIFYLVQFFDGFKDQYGGFVLITFYSSQ